MTESHQSWKKYLFIFVLAISLVSMAWHLYLSATIQDYGMLFDERDEGSIVVTSVAPGSNAEDAGMIVGDVVTSVNGRDLGTSEEEPLAVIVQEVRGPQLELGVSRGGDELIIFLEPSHPGLNFRFLLVMIVSLLFVVMGAWVFFARPNYQAANAWGFFAVMLSSFVLSIGSEVSEGETIGIFFQIIRVAQVLFGVTAGLHFALVFPRVGSLAKRRWLIPTLYVIPTLIVFLVIVLVVVLSLFSGLQELSGLFSMIINFAIEGLFVLYMLAMIIVLLITYLTTSDRNERQRIRIIIFGTALPFAAILLSIPLTSFVNLDAAVVNTILLLAMMVIPFTYLYAIVRYRAMQMQLILKRGLIYSMVTGAVLVLAGIAFVSIFGLMLLIQDFLPGALGREGGTFYQLASDENVQKFVIAVMSVFIGATVGNIKRKVQTFVDRRFYRSRYTYKQAVERLTAVISQTHDLSQMMDMTINTCEEIVHPQSASILVIGENDGASTQRAFPSQLEEVRLKPDTVLALKNLFKTERAFISIRELNEERFVDGELIHGALTRLNADIMLPLRLHAKKKMLGFLALGRKLSETTYDSEELNLLTLLADQAALSLEHIFLATEAAEKEKLKRELTVGRVMQERMLPGGVPEIPGVKIAALNNPAREVSGDFYTFITDTDSCLGIVVGDIVGKGVAGALNMAAVISSLSFIVGETKSISDALQRLNRHLVRTWPKRSFAAITYAQVQIDQRIFRWSSGGLPDPLYIPAEGEPRYLELDSYPLPPGSSAQSTFTEHEIQCAPGDVVLLLTDGAVEVSTLDGREMIGYEGMLEMVEKLRDKSPQDFVSGLASQIHSFRGSTVLDDDLTAVVIKFE